MSSWHSYPSIYNLGHAAIAELLSGPVCVEEKVDGSQFSFAYFPESENPLRCRSKGAVLNLEAPEKMFTLGVETAKRLAPLLTPNWTYRGEYLKTPKHNALVYNRIPAQNVILFDINTDEETYLSQEDKRAEAERLGLEVVPLLFTGKIEAATAIRDFLARESVLGGQPIEGVVIKPIAYDLFGRDKKVLFGKFVSEAFKEVHSKSWGEANPSNKDAIAIIAGKFATQARWMKAVQHLRERGEITDSPQDISKLFKEVSVDTLKECEDEIKHDLFKHAWPEINRRLTRGLPEWYKDTLLKKAFEGDAA